MIKVLVTGAGGFIGKAALKSLSDKNEIELHAVYHTHEPVIKNMVHWHKADLLNAQETDKLFAAVAPTHFLQLAWCSEHGKYWNDPTNLDWMIAGIHAARSFVQYGGQRAVFIGTSAEYQWPGSQPFNEFSSPLRPASLYGGCKLGLYYALSNYFEQQKISWAWPRLFNPFGEGEDRRRLIPKTCLRLLKGERIEFDAAGSIRDFLDVQDVGNALATITTANINGAVNVGSGEPLPVRAVIEQVAACCGRSELVKFGQADADGAADWVVADTNQLRTAYQWQPQQDLRQRIREA